MSFRVNLENFGLFMDFRDDYFEETYHSGK